MPDPRSPHTDAAARFPHVRAFPAGEWGAAFHEAKQYAESLGLTKVRRSGDENGDHADLDGVILPGSDTQPFTGPPIARWLGAVTLYWRDRAAVGGDRG